MRRPLTVIALAAVALAAVAPALANGNWPEFRGPTADGHARASDLPVEWSATKNVVWKTPIHGRGWSSPVIWENQIWLTTATENGKQQFAVCVDRDSGRIVHDILLYENENPAFRHERNSYASPTPAIEEGRVYIHFGSYGTACLDTRTGAVLWSRRDLPCDHFRGPGSSPILWQDLLIVHFDGFDYQYVVALDKSTGETVWKADRDVDYGTDNGDFMKAYATPIVIDAGGRPQLISPTSKAVVAYDPRTGDELWQVQYTSFSTSNRPLYANGLVYVSTGFGKADLYAIRPDGRGNVTDTHVAWKAGKGIPSVPSQLLVGERLYMIDDKGVASCLDAATGEILWQERVGGAYSASPIHAGGHLYFFSHEGTATVIQPGDKFHFVARNTLGDDPDVDGFMSSPAVSGNALYLRTKGHLYRIEKK